MKPHSSYYRFQLNSRGFHDVEFDVEKKPGTFRAVGLGDSFAFGVVPYQFNYLTVIEEHMKTSGVAFELINMGIPGIGPREYLAILIHEALQLKLDMVLVSFFIGNDFLETTKVNRLHQWSYLANLVKYVHDMRTKLGNIQFARLDNYDDEGSVFTDAAYIELERLSSGIFQKANRYWQTRLADTVVHLANIKKICDLHGIQLVMALIPDEMQVDTTLQRQVIEASGVGKEAFDFELPNGQLKRELTRLRIDHIDLLPDFRKAAASGSRLYRRNDTHWNIKGNVLAAELILRHLQDCEGEEIT
jgi:SGNH hydrolase-like domain, acetyltransferase AlgX